MIPLRISISLARFRVYLRIVGRGLSVFARSAALYFFCEKLPFVRWEALVSEVVLLRVIFVV